MFLFGADTDMSQVCKQLLALCIFVTLLFANSLGYNVQTDSASYINGPVVGSHFGYSVVSHQIDDHSIIWIGAPKFSETNEIHQSVAKKGTIYKCLSPVSNNNKFSKKINCTRVSLKETPYEGTSKIGIFQQNLSGMALDSCDMEKAGLCGFTNSPETNLKWTKTSRSGIHKKKTKRKVRYLRQCKYRKGFSTCQRISGPAAYTVNDQYLNADSDVFKLGNAEPTKKKYILVSPFIFAQKGQTQCLRFCFNAYSACKKCKRMLNVTLDFSNSSSGGVRKHVFLFDGTIHNASVYWNHTEINITSPIDGSFKIHFEATVFNNFRASFPYAGIADIVLSDINVSHLPCGEEKDGEDEIDSEESLGLSLKLQQTSRKNASVATCGPLWQHNCGYAKEANGVCYEIDTNNARVSRISKMQPISQECIRGKIDIVLLVDQSGSVNQCNFQKVKRWLRNIVRGFTFGFREQDVGIVVYSDEHKIRKVVKLGFLEFGNSGKIKMNSMLASLRNLRYEAGKTYTGSALGTANQMLFGSNARPDAKKMIILLTDGSTTKANRKILKREYNRSRNKSVTILAVGVGKYDKKELIAIAGNEKNFFAVKRFSELEKVRDKLRKSVSQTNLEGGSSKNLNETSQNLQQCQIGFSVHYSKHDLIMGSPGCYDQTGNVVTHRREKATVDGSSGSGDSRQYTDDITDVGEYVQLHQESRSQFLIPTLGQIRGVFNTESHESYFGYSVSSGKYFGPFREFFASSAPRHNGSGCVLLFSYSGGKLVGRHNMCGKQFGEYFGATMVTEDINQDGYDDLLVGAPLHTAKHPDEGRAYVYLGGRKMSTDHDFSLKGNTAAFARFGSVIAAVGDLNADGYPDIAVSSPLEEGTGIVYIYQGCRKGIHAISSQRIIPKHLQPVLDSPPLKNFGVSIAGKTDLNTDGFPDLIIGVSGSDAVVLLLSRPVIYINVSLNCGRPIEQQKISKSLYARNEIYLGCFECFVDFIQHGKLLLDNVDLEYNISLDTARSVHRAIFHANNLPNLRLDLNLKKKVTESHMVCLKKNIRNLMTPIGVSLHYDLKHKVKRLSNLNETGFSKQTTDSDGKNNSNTLFQSEEERLGPMLDKFSSLNIDTFLPFNTHCRNIALCFADVRLEASFIDVKTKTKVKEIVIGKEDTFCVKVNITNVGPEDAYDLSLHMQYSNDFYFSSIANKN